MKSIAWRIVLSILSVVGYGFINGILHPLSAIMSARAAGGQFESSDWGYLQSMAGMNFFSYIGIPSIVLLAVLVWIWWKPIKALLKSASDKDIGPKLLLAGLVAPSVFFGMTDNANAYFDKVDTTEVYYILPNETAFWVPSQGDRKAGQAALNTAEYFQENKVSAMLFKIPHMKLSGYNLMSWDPYVPAGRLIIVDHIAYHREWTASAKRGTAVKDQAIPCQSSEGVNVTVEISLTVSIKEGDAAKYLYNFGVDAPANVDRTHPETMFQSVYHAKKLDYVMDNIGRGVIVNAACAEISSRTFDKANAEAALIMQKIAATSTAFLNARGITVDSMGWAGTFEFDDAVQKAVNDRYIATAIGSSLPVLRTQADIKVKEGLAEGLKKGLPSFLPPAMASWFGNVFGSDSTPAVPAPAKK